MAKNKEIVVFEDSQELIQKIEEGQPETIIRKGIGFTVNLQSYESARIDCSVSISGALENIEAINQLVDAELEKSITSKIKELIEQVNPNTTLLGYKK